MCVCVCVHCSDIVKLNIKHLIINPFILPKIVSKAFILFRHNVIGAFQDILIYVELLNRGCLT